MVMDGGGKGGGVLWIGLLGSDRDSYGLWVLGGPIASWLVGRCAPPPLVPQMTNKGAFTDNASVSLIPLPGDKLLALSGESTSRM